MAWRSSLARIAQVLLVAGAAWSCKADPAPVTECPEGTELVRDPAGGSAAASCRALPPVTAIKACPEGALLDGEAPPRGLRQRCEKGEAVRHGASREWWESHRERTYSEWWEGKKHGRFKLTYENGQVKAEGAHRHGEPAGEWKYHGEDGTVKQQQTFPLQPPPANWVDEAIAGRPPEPPPAAPDATGQNANEPGRLATHESAGAAPSSSN
jgi:hypothetical protein